MKRRFYAALAALLLISACTTETVAPTPANLTAEPNLNVIVLGSGPRYMPKVGFQSGWLEDVNNAGVSVGRLVSPGAIQAVKYDAGGRHFLLTPPSGNASQAYGINEAGYVVGSYSVTGQGGGTATTAVYWTPDEQPVALAGSGGFATGAYDINENGLIVGFVHDATGTADRAGYWKLDRAFTPLALPVGAQGSRAYGVNDNGDIVGETNFADRRDLRPTLWTAPHYEPRLLPVPAGFFGGQLRAISNSGVIVGAVGYSPAVWFTANSSPTVITGPDEIAEDVNENGVVVGASAFAWSQESGVQVLPSGGYATGRAINDHGIVVGYDAPVFDAEPTQWSVVIQSDDTDADGVTDVMDNCRTDPNADQLDTDTDGLGDRCDLFPTDPLNDADRDGVSGEIDNCPSVANPDQLDTDSDGSGDRCDDRDGDGLEDAADSCPDDRENDADRDGICGDVDNAPRIYNPRQEDGDSDGIGDVVDNCPRVINPDQRDGDSDGIGDACEANTPPVLATIGNKTVDELVLLTFAASASDADIPANSLTYSLDAGAPVGASINSTTGEFAWTPTEAQGPNSYSITVRVTDSGSPNVSAAETFQIQVNEVNLPPVLTAIGNKIVNEVALLSFTATATDPDVSANTLTFSLIGAPAGANITTGGAFTWTPTEAQGSGDHTFKVRVTDNGSANLSDEESITVRVNEVNVAPVLASIGNKSVDEGSLLTFTASATDADVSGNTLTFSLGADAPAGASIDPSTGVFTWTPTNGTAQSQSITIHVTDDGSPAMNDYETINVTVNNVVPVIGTINFVSTPIAVGTNNVTVTWNFIDPGTETWTCSIEWDSGSGLTDASYVGPKSCNATATLPAGVYTARVKVADDVGSDIDELSAYVVVYDPNGGFVTGGGWINSPAGAYVPDPSSTGRANFGFVSKYQQGKTMPQGNTEFQFHAANLNFKSTVYEWLVVAGTRAQFKGDGTINGVAGYGFLLTGIDDGPDKFRIKIVRKSDGTVIYDNESGNGDDLPATTALGGGSIVIHTKK